MREIPWGILWIVLWCALRPPAADAGELPLDRFGRLVTIEEAIDRTVESDAAVRRALVRLQGEKAKLDLKQAQFFPEVKGDTFAGFASGESGRLAFLNVRIEQPLFEGGRRLYEKRKQAVRLQMSESELAITKLNLALEVRLIYSKLLHEKEMVRLIQDVRNQVSVSYEKAKTLFDQALITRAQLIEAEVLNEKTKQALLLHKEKQDYLQEVLSRALGMGPGEALELEPLGELPRLHEAIDDYLRGAHDDPAYRLQDLRVREKELEKKALGAKRWPSLMLTGGWEVNRDVYVDFNRAVIGLKGSWNIWDFGRLHAQMKAAESEIEEAKWQRIIQAREKEKRVRELFHEARIARGDIALREKFLASRSEDYKNLKTKQIAGETDEKDALSGFLDLESAREAMLEAVTQFRVLAAKLERESALLGVEMRGEIQ